MPDTQNPVPWWKNRNVIILLTLAVIAVLLLSLGLAFRNRTAAVIRTDSPTLDTSMPTAPAMPHSGSSGAPEAEEAEEASGTDIDWENTLYLVVTIQGVTYQPIPMLRELDLPIDQGDGVENVIHITPDGAWMLSATCDNQDCVKMGPVTRENMHTRILFNMVVCLPHQMMFEVMDWTQLQQLYGVRP